MSFYKKSMSIVQLLHVFVEELMRRVPVMGYAGDAIDVSGQTTEVKRVVFVAPCVCCVRSADLISSLGLAADDTNYLSITLKNGADAMAAAADTTKATGGAAIVANTRYPLTIDQKNTLAAGEEVELSVIPATSSVANDLAHVQVALGISYDEVDAL